MPAQKYIPSCYERVVKNSVNAITDSLSNHAASSSVSEPHAHLAGTEHRESTVLSHLDSQQSAPVAAWSVRSAVMLVESNVSEQIELISDAIDSCCSQLLHARL